MKNVIEMSSVMACVTLVVVEYVLVLMAVIADLISGVRKAHRRGEARRSKAFRRTVDKLARYYNAMFGLTVIDCMQMGGILYLHSTDCLTNVPMLPLFTMLGAIGMALIEIKSIYEKAEEKERNEYEESMRMLAKAIRSVVKDDELKAIVKSQVGTGK